MHEYYSDIKAPYYSTYQIVEEFHDEDDNDPYWKVKQAYTLLIAAASEIVVGKANLWRQGKSGGRHEFPNFGKYMCVNQFKCFVAAAAYCWTDKRNWYLPFMNDLGIFLYPSWIATMVNVVHFWRRSLSL